MGLEHIVRDLKHDAKAEAETLLSDAKRQADKIVTEAEAKSAELERAGTARARKEAARIMGASTLAKIETARAQSLIEMELYAQVANKVREKLYSEYRDRRAYDKYVVKAVKDGSGMVGKDYVIHANKRDSAIAKKYGPLAKGPLDCEGGVVVASPDGRIRADSTFEAAFSEREQEVINAARRIMKNEK